MQCGPWYLGYPRGRQQFCPYIPPNKREADYFQDPWKAVYADALLRFVRLTTSTEMATSRLGEVGSSSPQMNTEAKRALERP